MGTLSYLKTSPDLTNYRLYISWKLLSAWTFMRPWWRGHPWFQLSVQYEACATWHASLRKAVRSPHAGQALPLHMTCAHRSFDFLFFIVSVQDLLHDLRLTFSVASHDKLYNKPQWNWRSVAMWGEGTAVVVYICNLTKPSPEEF